MRGHSPIDIAGRLNTRDWGTSGFFHNPQEGLKNSLGIDSNGK